MYASTIGHTFLKAYNRTFNTTYTGKSFFEEIFVPLFFDHNKYMMTGGNSPLENPKLSWADMIKGDKPFEKEERRKERIAKMIHKIETEQADASIAVGYGAANETAATTCQITNIDFSDNKEDIYISWVGAGLGIGVADGLTILFNNEQLLLDLYEGWQYYRLLLERYPNLKGNQINTWNGNWILHRYDWLYDKDDPMSDFHPMENYNDGLPTVPWAQILICIAQKIPQQNLVGYLYNIGKSNTTIGFIPFKLQDILKPNQLYARIFGKPAWEQNRKHIEALYGTAFSLKFACKAGCIGIPALEPKGLREYFPTQKNSKKTPKRENDNQIITFNTYLIWILTMLNNEKLWDMSRDFAEQLLKYEVGADKAKTDRINKVNQLLDSASSKQFISNLIPIVKDETDKDPYETIGKLVNSMPKENFPYFNTLIRFQYALLNQ